MITGDGENELRGRLRREPPPETARWNLLDDGVSVEILSPQLRADAADEFVTAFLERMSRRTWRFHVWRP